jgi:hypothetical protein
MITAWRRAVSNILIDLIYRTFRYGTLDTLVARRAGRAELASGGFEFNSVGDSIRSHHV